MAKERPNLSITLPRNFVFHYADGAEPKTPERELSPPQPASPQPYRIRRRPRPTVMPANTFHGLDDMQGRDLPLPSIETRDAPPFLTSISYDSAPTTSHLSSTFPARAWLPPRTPEEQRTLAGIEWSPSTRKLIGDSIARPRSGFSSVSNSDFDASDYESEDGTTFGGSCTSPESDAPEPFAFRGGKAQVPAVVLTFDQHQLGHRQQHSHPVGSRVFWTAEMDKHLWSIYMAYLQDPTVTPFKMLPGTAPPLGVCHRIARQARRSWKGGKSLHGALDQNPRLASSGLRRGGSTETLTVQDSKLLAPPEFHVQQQQQPPQPPVWPKSSSSTRRRLRELVKSKATIAPHYQRLLQSRSPSPFSSSSRPTSRRMRLSSPFRSASSHSPYTTRDVHMSLATSTSATMQPDGPIAQLSGATMESSPPAVDWFNDPSVPWASPVPVPSDQDQEMLGQQSSALDTENQSSRLGSPFQYHTWGPGKFRRSGPPRIGHLHTQNLHASVPRLRSPLRLHEGFPYPNPQKRRAQSQLEEDLSPGHVEEPQRTTEDVFQEPTSGEGSRRRVRTRGFSLGDALAEERITRLFTPPNENEASTTQGLPVPAPVVTTPGPVITTSQSLRLPSDSTGHPGDPIMRLGSPFDGISSRPRRARGRHLASASLPSNEAATFSSIDQLLDPFNSRSNGLQ